MFIDIFQELLAENSLNKKQFAEQSGIPYPTVIGWTNLNRLPDYTALKKIADFFRCSADVLLEREENDKYTPPLSADEQRLLLCYRSADAKTQQALLHIAERTGGEQK